MNAHGPTGNAEIGYRFTQAQLAAIFSTKLDTNRFRAYVEKRWPIERLRAYCTPTNTLPYGYQNLVALQCPVETDVHKDRRGVFGRIWAYVSEDDGRGTYIGEAGTKWHRWKYSLNVEQGRRHWVIIEDLPNDFMDSAKYDIGKTVQATATAPGSSMSIGEHDPVVPVASAAASGCACVLAISSTGLKPGVNGKERLPHGPGYGGRRVGGGARWVN